MYFAALENNRNLATLVNQSNYSGYIKSRLVNTGSLKLCFLIIDCIEKKTYNKALLLGLRL